MNYEEYQKWYKDAETCLSLRYNADDTKIIMDWFSRIKGQCERELIGNDAVDAMLTFVTAGGKFDVYNSLMCRLFIYAPLILEEARG